MTTPPARCRWLWLSLIILLGLILRGRHLLAPFQLDEFGPLYAIGERRDLPAGVLPSQRDPLVLVPTWEDVRQRSVLPYGIVQAFPLYHYLLYAQSHVLPLTDWALRLPSLFAGLGCILAIYGLGRRGSGEAVALSAALLVAVEPLQIQMSVIARPYALANLACVLSWVALLRLLECGSARAALGYLVCVVLMGYLNTLYLLVGAPQLLLVGCWLRRGTDRGRKLGLWFAAGLLAGVLLLPQLSYLRAVGQFAREHQEYLNLVLLGTARFGIVLLHNYGVLGCLLILSLAGLVRVVWRPELTPDDTLAPAGPDAWLVEWGARLWFFIPQLLAVGFMYVAEQAMFLSRYIGYTTLGAALLLATAAARAGSRRFLQGTIGLMVLFLLVFGERPASRGFNIKSWNEAQAHISWLDRLDQAKEWRAGDVVLLRPAFLEADFLPTGFPEATRPQVEGVVAAPWTTLYASRTRKPFVCLSLSQRHEERYTEYAGHLYDPTILYNEALAQRLRPYQRLWLFSFDWERHIFAACFLPWLADALSWDLRVWRKRDQSYDILTDQQPTDAADGIVDPDPMDWPPVVRIERLRPRGIYQLGAFLTPAAPNAHITFPIWLVSEARTPRSAGLDRIHHHPDKDYRIHRRP